MDPIDMLLFCPRCHNQHIDQPNHPWTNPPHRTHQCHFCGTQWRPADVPTNGVAKIETHGEKDNWSVEEGSGGPALAVVRYGHHLLETSGSFEYADFVSYWFEGDFDSCRTLWPSAPDACYMGADSTFFSKETKE